MAMIKKNYHYNNCNTKTGKMYTGVFIWTSKAFKMSKKQQANYGCCVSTQPNFGQVRNLFKQSSLVPATAWSHINVCKCFGTFSVNINGEHIVGTDGIVHCVKFRFQQLQCAVCHVGSTQQVLRMYSESFPWQSKSVWHIRYSDFNSAAIMLDRTRKKKKKRMYSEKT